MGLIGDVFEIVGDIVEGTGEVVSRCIYDTGETLDDLLDEIFDDYDD